MSEAQKVEQSLVRQVAGSIPVIHAKEGQCARKAGSPGFASIKAGGFANDVAHRHRCARRRGVYALLGQAVKLHVQGIGLVDFEGITFQCVPALKLVSHHAPELLLTGRLLEAVITVKLKDVDLSDRFHLHALNHRP